MNITDPGEFWNALGRLYDVTVKLHDTTENLAEIAKSHEHRLDRGEITVVAFQEDLRDIKSELRAIRERLDGLEKGRA